MYYYFLFISFFFLFLGTSSKRIMISNVSINDVLFNIKLNWLEIQPKKRERKKKRENYKREMRVIVLDEEIDAIRQLFFLGDSFEQMFTLTNEIWWIFPWEKLKFFLGQTFALGWKHSFVHWIFCCKVCGSKCLVAVWGLYDQRIVVEGQRDGVKFNNLNKNLEPEILWPYLFILLSPYQALGEPSTNGFFQRA